MKNSIIRKIFLVVFVSFCFVNLNATHNRAGEITYIQLTDLTYQFTITTYTYFLSLAKRPTLDVEWGDNTVTTAVKISETILPNYYQKNVYIINHTFPGPGIYKIIVQDPNRNAGVKNIPNSVNVIFSMSTILTVNPSMGRNNTPVLLNPPYDKAAYHYIFIHNPAAYDPDGDSLSYKLTDCKREDGKPIEGYTFPPATTSIRVDSITGDLIWNTPADTGAFNVAMEIHEWRNGKRIGIVEREMQINVYTTTNNPPVNSPLSDYCVEAGDTVDFVFSATDANNDSLSLRATSGIFTLASCPAKFTKIDSVLGYASSRFRWIPCHNAVRSQPYDVIFKSDDYNSDVKLSDIDHMKIKVLGPSPNLLNAVPEGKLIRLTWSEYGTSVIAGFSIYRREGASTYVADSCTAGIPSSTGFKKVGYIDGSSKTSYSDSDNGLGLLFGKEYTYRIVAVYPNGTESKASNEITSTLVSGVPVVRNVSIRNTDAVNGSIYVSWKKPDKLDTIPNVDGPFAYHIYRANGVGGTDYNLIKFLPTTDLNDTILIDSLKNFNTEVSGYIYKIELWNKTPGDSFLIGEPAYASSVFLTAAPGDKKVRFAINRNVPWINTRYDFFRQNESTLVYDSVGSTNQLSYIDNGLENGKQYCYYVRSVGGYLADNLPKNLINFSEVICATPVDNEPPCPPVIDVISKCDSLYNKITWSISDPVCFDDIAGYKIYSRMKNVEDFTLLTTINDKNIFSFIHYPEPGETIAGCYSVKAFDALGNEGLSSVIVCIDSCNFYEIPNVFTPNGDNINDKLLAKTSGLVEKIDFRLFNRDGLLLFRTEKPEIDWDGTYKGKIVSPGVYFYYCDVWERRISGIELKRLNGFVHVITVEGAKLNKLETK
jgi:gliding motility-associated-like protein